MSKEWSLCMLLSFLRTDFTDIGLRACLVYNIYINLHGVVTRSCLTVDVASIESTLKLDHG